MTIQHCGEGNKVPGLGEGPMEATNIKCMAARQWRRSCHIRSILEDTGCLALSRDYLGWERGP